MANSQLPKSFDPRKLARQSAQFEGLLALNTFGRLLESLADDKGEVQVALRFSMSEDHRIVLKGSVKASLMMVCQRCLEAARVPVHSDFQLMGVLTDEQAKALPEDFEPLFYGDELVELIPLLEEELLLALPLIPFHPPEDCPVQQDFTTESEQEAREAAIAAGRELEKSNPFSVLAKLKTETTT